MRNTSSCPSVSEYRSFASEVKYVIDKARANAIREWARKRFKPDPDAAEAVGDTYRTSSLYLDTEDFDVLQRTGSFGRCKYRIRRYGLADTLFLERKLRTTAVVIKRRTVVPMGQLENLTREKAAGGWDGYWFHRRLLLRRLQPACHINYVRTALVGKSENGRVRLTIDDEVRAIPAVEYGFGGTGESFDIVNGNNILELKFYEAMPAVFESLVKEFNLEPASISKYRLAAPRIQALGKAA